jgi:hypothetical protein
LSSIYTLPALPLVLPLLIADVEPPVVRGCGSGCCMHVTNRHKYPIISKIAKDYLAIPATLAPLECVFSSGSDVQCSPNSIRIVFGKVLD